MVDFMFAMVAVLFLVMVAVLILAIIGFMIEWILDCVFGIDISKILRKDG